MTRIDVAWERQFPSRCTRRITCNSFEMIQALRVRLSELGKRDYCTRCCGANLNSCKKVRSSSANVGPCCLCLAASLNLFRTKDPGNVIMLPNSGTLPKIMHASVLECSARNLVSVAPSMPPRLSHTKSRTGCYRCKARKVKCDEAHPQCQNCARHNVECRYPKHTHATNKQSPATELRVEACLTADERRHLEQQLLHYFSSSIVWTLGSSQNSTGREVWSYTAVELGFKHAFLHNSILAFAALYLLKTTPESRRFFAPLDEHESASRAVNRDIKLDCPVPLSTIHELYLDLALRQQREAATKLTAESANAFWLSTMLHWYQAAPHFSHDLVDDGYAPPVNWLRMVNALLLPNVIIY